MATLTERSFRLATLGYVPEDDPEIVADMQLRIDELEQQVKLWRDRWEASEQAFNSAIIIFNHEFSEFFP